MERGGHDVLVAYGDDLRLIQAWWYDGTQNFHTVVNALHPRCADEDRMDWTSLDPVKINISLEGLDLTTKSVAAHCDIEGAKGLLIFGAV